MHAQQNPEEQRLYFRMTALYCRADAGVKQMGEILHFWVLQARSNRYSLILMRAQHNILPSHARQNNSPL